MKKRILSILLTLCMMLTLLPTVALAAEVTGLTGTGTESDPYQIRTLDELKWFRDQVNGGEDYSAKYVKLMADIDLSSIANWTPIGNGERSGSTYKTYAFKGTFDGNGKTISNLKITANVSDTDANKAFGLFGVVDGGTVQNLTLENVAISGNGDNVGAAIGLMVGGATADKITVSGTVAGADGVGGIVGRMTISGTISGCTNNAKVSSAKKAGGIVGAAYYTAESKEMTISGCENTGAVTSDAGYVGGIAGLSAAKVSGCENSGAITGNGTSIGGIVGEQQSYGGVTGCTNSGEVKNNKTDNSAFGTGGIVGWVRYNESAKNYPRKAIIAVTDNINSGTVTGGWDAGGIVGSVYHAANVTGNENTATSLSSSNFVAGIVGSFQAPDDAEAKKPIQGTSNDSETIPLKKLNCSNNVSTTPDAQMTGSCKSLYVYDNVNTANTGEIKNNSTAWEAQIGDTKYATLISALETAREGDTITIYAGSYKLGSLDHFNFKAYDGTNGGAPKNLTITAADGASVVLDSLCFNARSFPENLTVKNITFDGSLASGENSEFESKYKTVGAGGIYSHKSVTGLTVENCTFKNGAFLSLADETATSITVKDCVFDGVADNSNAIYIQYVNGLTVTNCTVKNGSYNAIQCNSGVSGDITITNNTFSGTKSRNIYLGGLNSEYTGTLTVSGNSFCLPSDPKEDGNYMKTGAAVTIGVNTYAVDPTANMSYYFTNVTITAAPSSSSTGVSKYAVTVEETANGSVTASAQRAAKGRTVTLTVTPDKGYALETLTVLDKNGDALDLTDNGDGTYSFKMPAGKVTVTATFMDDNTMLNFFVDVPVDAYYYDAVLWAAKKEITGGIDATHFGPDLTCTRAQLVTFLWRAAGCPVVNYAMSFTDVDESEWYGEAVRWAASLGIVGGYGNGLFGTNDEVLREQVVTILYRYAVVMGMDVSVGEDTNILSYNDALAVSEYAVSAFQWATGAGIVQGADGKLMPQDSCTRGQIVTMLYRLLGE